MKLKLSLAEIATGVDKKIRIQRLQTCNVCNGDGAADGDARKICASCGGTGEIRQVSHSIFGQFVNMGTCRVCGGSGEVIIRPCPKCGGEGRVRGTTTISVKIPSGVKNGNYIPIRGKGNAGLKGGSAGDVLVIIEEKEDEYFVRDDDDIICEVPISFSQAALGDDIVVPALNGQTSVHIPPGTQSGQIFRLKGKGIKHLRTHGNGDELVRIVVWTPTKLDGEAKKLFAELAQKEGLRPPQPGKDFWGKVKGALGM